MWFKKKKLAFKVDANHILIQNDDYDPRTGDCGPNYIKSKKEEN